MQLLNTGSTDVEYFKKMVLVGVRFLPVGVGGYR